MVLHPRVKLHFTHIFMLKLERMIINGKDLFCYCIFHSLLFSISFLHSTNKNYLDKFTFLSFSWGKKFQFLKFAFSKISFLKSNFVLFQSYFSITSWTRASTMVGRTFGYLLSQTIIKTGIGTYLTINQISLISPILAFIFGLCFPQIQWKSLIERIKITTGLFSFFFFL